MEAASKYLSIGEKSVRKFEFVMKRVQVYRVYPQIFFRDFPIFRM